MDLVKLNLLTLIFIASFVHAKSQQIISIETNDTGLYYKVTGSGEVQQVYLGSKLINPDELVKMENPTMGEAVRHFDAYPMFGNRNINEVALAVVHADGNMTTDLRYVSHEAVSVGGVNYLQIRLKDTYYNFFVTLHIKAYESANVFVSHSEIRHAEEGPVVLNRFASAYLGFKSSSYWLTHYYGSWAHEMNFLEEELDVGIKNIESKRGVRTTQAENSAFMLSFNHPAREDEGEVIAGALAWSGNYKMTFQVDNIHNLHLIAGINNFASAYTLKTNEVFETPDFIFTYSHSGKGKASRNLHAWTRKYNLQDGDEIRPVVLNSWEGAYFDFDEKRIHQMMNDAKKMGVEVFVLDDGWFGNKYPRNSDHAGLGDWKVNLKKLPHGIKGLTAYAEKLGLQFGIWVEPEMVNPKSELAEMHPDWIVQRKNRDEIPMRNQLLLDLTDPEVKNYVFGVVDDILSGNSDIRYVKWDANRHVENFGSTHLPADLQSHFWIEYIRGLYEIYDQLVQKYPDVIFQVCSSGGGRLDYGSLKYHHEFWTSDNTDALSRVYMQWNTNHFFPAMATAAHVSMVPNHQTGVTIPLKFRFAVAMSGRFGVELLPAKLNSHEMAYAKETINLYKDIRQVVQLGDLYRLASPYEGNFASSMYVKQDLSKAVVFIYITKFSSRDELPRIRLKGLDPEKRYRIKEIGEAKDVDNDNSIYIGEMYKFSRQEQVYSGDLLMKNGLELRMHRMYESAILELQEVK